MGWLSKIVLNGVDMLIKDASARESLLEISNKLNALWNGQNGENKYYVSADGNDSTGDGTNEHPFATIQHAYNVAVSYAIANHNAITIFLKGGHFYENVVIGSTFLTSRVIIDALADSTIHGSLYIRNCECEILGAGENVVIDFYSDNLTHTADNADKIVTITENAKVFWNAKSSIYSRNTDTFVSRAIEVLYNSFLYTGWGIDVYGNYTDEVLMFVYSGGNIDIDVSTATGSADIYATFSNIIDRTGELTLTSNLTQTSLPSSTMAFLTKS